MPSQPLRSQIIMERTRYATDPHGAPFQINLVAVAQATDDGKRKRRNVHLILDRSGSMDGEKLRHAKVAIHAVLAELDSHDSVSLIAFAGTAKLVASGKPKEVDQYVDGIGIEGCTNIPAALRLVNSNAPTVNAGQSLLDRLNETPAENKPSHHMVVLLTDGQNYPDAEALDSETLAEAQRLGEIGCPIYTIGIGTDYNQDLLMQIANMTNGRQFHNSGGSLDADLLGAIRMGAATVENVKFELVLKRELARVHMQVQSPPARMIHPPVKKLRFPKIDMGGAKVLLVLEYNGPQAVGLVDLGCVNIFVGDSLVATHGIKFTFVATPAEEDTSNPIITELWAKAQVNDLEAQLAATDNPTAEMITRTFTVQIAALQQAGMGQAAAVVRQKLADFAATGVMPDNNASRALKASTQDVTIG